MPGPLISDLDGTIADTSPAIFESLRIACAQVGIQLDPAADLSFALGPPLHEVLERLGIDDAQEAEAIAAFERAHTERLDLVTAMPGADVVLRELSEAGARIGVATIKPESIALLVLDAVGVRDVIDVLRARRDDLDPRTKTDLVGEVLAELPGGSPLYVGDHDGDEAAAAALGIPFLRYPTHRWPEIRGAVLG